MNRHDAPELFSGFSHTPPQIKDNELLTLYNPFYYDLSATTVTINPEWALAPGIILNWLAQSTNGAVRLILGVEADSPGNFLAFADRFAMGHNLTARDAASLYMLGHPTLAHTGTGGPRGEDLYLDEIPQYVGNLANYSGVVIGGELWFAQGSWWIDDNSGRYGSQRQRMDAVDRAEFRGLAFESVKRMFLARAGIDVGIFQSQT